MPKIALLALLVFWPVLNAGAQTAKAVSLQQNGWTISCFPDRSALSISADRLGSVARDLQFNLETPLGRKRLTQLTAHVSSEHKLIVETASPRSAWEFDAEPGKIVISTTDYHGVLTGWADSPRDRTISRLLDTEGLPVNWQGVNEVVETYGGSLTREPSYLPRRNPEVTYLGLGHVAADGLHSLFDRGTDIAIDFGEDATLQAAPSAKDAYALTIPVRDSAAIQIIPEYFTHSLGVPFYKRYDDTRFPSAPMVWSSWTSYFEAVTEQDIVRNADWLAANLKPYGFQIVQLDDGYDRRPEGHSWIENWNAERFPHGAAWLTNYIHSKGMKAGVWLVPNTYAPGLKEHPDWYLYDKQGRPLLDYDTPALDPTNPHVFDFLEGLFTKLDNLGFDYYKFDGEQALPKYAPSVDKSRLSSPTADFVQNYRDRLALIRRTIGPNRFIEVCPTGTPLNGIGFVDSYFNGYDLYNNWQGMYSLFSSINANLFMNHIVSYVMPGEGLELGEPMTMAEAAKKRPAITLEMERRREDPATGFGTTLPEARTLVTHIALTGVAYPLASVMPELPENRIDLLRATMPTLPILPIDLFSRGTDSSWDKFKHVQPDYYIHHYPEVLDVKIDAAAGVYDVVAETNWRSEPVERALDFARQLGLDAGSSYVIFDFWNQKPLGVFKNRINLAIEPHDTRVLSIHPVSSYPQLIGNSRHISGSYSILSQAWDGDKMQLHGESLPIAGRAYTLWFAVPQGYKMSSVVVNGKSSNTIPCEWKQQGDFASLRFIGTEEPVRWEIRF
jgi:alpha-galactosidase